MFSDVWRHRRGSVSIIAAVMIPGIVGVAGLGAEYGYGVLTKVESQRLADVGARGGAAVYSATSSTAKLQTAVANLATMNGTPSSDVTAAVVNSPRGDGNSAVQVTVSTSVPRVLSRIFGGGKTLPVKATAYVEIQPTSNPDCVIALSTSGSGITLSGGTTMTASSCAVASDNTVSVPNGTTLTTPTVDYDSSAAPTVKANIKATSGSVTYVQTPTSDPLSGNASVTGATAHLATLSTMTSPAAPTVTAPTVSGGTAITLSWYDSSNPPYTGLPPGCTATGVSYGPPWTIACTGAGSGSAANPVYNFGAISVPSGMATATITSAKAATFNFNGTISGYTISGPVTIGSGFANTYNLSGGISASGTTSFGAGTYNIGGNIVTSGTTSFGAGTYNIAGSVSTTGTTTFGAGTYTIAKGISTGGGSTTGFGAGTFTIGAGSSSSCDADSICNTGSSLSFAGPSTFVLSSGIYNSGGETLTLGTGSTSNSYRIGKDSSGYAIVAGGGANTTLANATGTGDLFQAVGNISTSGGSCLALPAATAHDIHGNIDVSGGFTEGSGTYSIYGYFAAGSNGGGAVTCNGASVGVSASGVTVVLAGPASGSGNCSGYVFCLTAGFSNVTLTGPGSGTMENLVVIGPTSSSVTGGALFDSGAAASMNGAVYFPHGPINLAGGASLGSGAGQCLEVIGSQVTLSGGSAVATACTGSGGTSLAGSGSGSSKLVLVQ
jgi:hypothetical protein